MFSEVQNVNVTAKLKLDLVEQGEALQRPQTSDDLLAGGHRSPTTLGELSASQCSSWHREGLISRTACLHSLPQNWSKQKWAGAWQKWIWHKLVPMNEFRWLLPLKLSVHASVKSHSQLRWKSVNTQQHKMFLLFPLSPHLIDLGWLCMDRNQDTQT